MRFVSVTHQPLQIAHHIIHTEKILKKTQKLSVLLSFRLRLYVKAHPGDLYTRQKTAQSNDTLNLYPRWSEREGSRGMGRMWIHFWVALEEDRVAVQTAVIVFLQKSHALHVID